MSACWDCLPCSGGALSGQAQARVRASTLERIEQAYGRGPLVGAGGALGDGGFQAPDAATGLGEGGSDGCGCRSTGSAGGLWMLGLLLITIVHWTS